MSETKFTNGPWEWDDNVPTDYFLADWQNTAPWLVNRKGEPILNGQIACRNTADTALIAAAPDLYEALDKAAMFLSGTDFESSDEYQEAMHILAKARGES